MRHLLSQDNHEEGLKFLLPFMESKACGPLDYVLLDVLDEQAYIDRPKREKVFTLDHALEQYVFIYMIIHFDH